jgi:hypothetical protein
MKRASRCQFTWKRENEEAYGKIGVMSALQWHCSVHEERRRWRSFMVPDTEVAHFPELLWGVFFSEVFLFFLSGTDLITGFWTWSQGEEICTTLHVQHYMYNITCTTLHVQHCWQN